MTIQWYIEEKIQLKNRSKYYYPFGASFQHAPFQSQIVKHKLCFKPIPTSYQGSGIFGLQEKAENNYTCKVSYSTESGWSVQSINRRLLSIESLHSSPTRGSWPDASSVNRYLRNSDSPDWCQVEDTKPHTCWKSAYILTIHPMPQKDWVFLVRTWSYRTCPSQHRFCGRIPSAWKIDIVFI